MNHTLIVSNISITKAITKLTSMNAYFGSTTLIRNDTLKSIKNSKTIGKNQFTQLWAVNKYDYKKFDILFIQESPWFFICTIPSSSSKERDSIVGAPNHSDWLTFSRLLNNNGNYPKIISYINTRLFHIHFSLRKDIFNYKNINCFFFFNNSDIFFIINIYSDD